MPARKFITGTPAGLRAGKLHHAFSMTLTDPKEHQEISDAATAVAASSVIRLPKETGPRCDPVIPVSALYGADAVQIQ